MMIATSVVKIYIVRENALHWLKLEGLQKAVLGYKWEAVDP